jgi:hypothetical protein
MRSKSLFIGLVLMTSSAFAVDSKKCSYENLEKMLRYSAGFSDHIVTLYTDAAKLVYANESEKLSAKEIKARFRELEKENLGKFIPTSSEIDAFLKKHPECDKNHYFTLRQKIEQR